MSCTFIPTPLDVCGPPYLAASSAQQGNVGISLFQAALQNGSITIVIVIAVPLQAFRNSNLRLLDHYTTITQLTEQLRS